MRISFFSFPSFPPFHPFFPSRMHPEPCTAWPHFLFKFRMHCHRFHGQPAKGKGRRTRVLGTILLNFPFKELGVGVSELKVEGIVIDTRGVVSPPHPHPLSPPPHTHTQTHTHNVHTRRAHMQRVFFVNDVPEWSVASKLPQPFSPDGEIATINCTASQAEVNFGAGRQSREGQIQYTQIAARIQASKQRRIANVWS